MYGLKPSPTAWQLHFASVMSDLGLKRLKSDPNLYYHPKYKVYRLCYRDDVLLFGAKADPVVSKLVFPYTSSLVTRSGGRKMTSISAGFLVPVPL